MSQGPEHETWIWLARIRRPQGRKGEVFAEILTDFPQKFTERRRLWLLSESNAAPREAELKAYWLHKGGVVLHFAGVDTITDAEGLAGLVVAVPRAERTALAADEVHIADLIGCQVVSVAEDAAVVVGEIENVERATGMAPILIVRGTHGEVLIPFAQSYLRRLDLEGRRVEMELPEGLVELNRDQGTGTRDQGTGTRDQGTGTREQGTREQGNEKTGTEGPRRQGPRAWGHRDGEAGE